MRVIRLFGSVLTILTTGLLLASPGAAQPPSKLTDHITDTTGVLTDPGRATVSAAIDRLYRDRHIQLWVVYVDNFSRFKPDNWADKTRSASRLGGQDALLAIATNTKAYSFTVPPQVQGPTEAGLNNLRRNQIEPVLGAKDWSGAAVAAADGLDKLASSAKPASSSKPIWPLIAIGVIVVVVLLLLFVLYRARRAALRGTVIRCRRRYPPRMPGYAKSRTTWPGIATASAPTPRPGSTRPSGIWRRRAAKNPLTTPKRSRTPTGRRPWPLRRRRWPTPTC